MLLKTINSLIIILTILTLLSCKDKIVEPKVNEDNLEPGRRDYVWTLDTIITYNNSLYSIWGAAPNDIWLGGMGGVTSYDNLWHFDGKKWKPYDKQYIGTFPNCIFGFNSDDIWIGGNDGNIWHYNGSSWERTLMMYDNSNIWDIYGASPTNVYALGTRFILKYESLEWKEELRIPNNVNIYMQEMLGDESGIYIWGTKPSPLTSSEPDTLCFWKYEDETIKQIFLKTTDEIVFSRMNYIGDQVYFLIGQDLYKNENNKFIKVISFNEKNFGYAFNGRNEKDIFLRNLDGVAHYNGKDVQYLYKFNSSHLSLYEPAIFEKEIFIPGEDYINGYKFVLHGKLKNK